MTQAEFQRYQEQTFDSYVKRLIRNEGRNAKKELSRRGEREVTPYHDLPAMSHEDRYVLEKLAVHSGAGGVEALD